MKLFKHVSGLLSDDTIGWNRAADGSDSCPYHFSRIFPVVFQNLGSPSQTVDRDGVSHQQDRMFGRQLNMQPGAP